MLIAMGARITGIGSNILRIEGVKRSGAPSSASAPTTWRWGRSSGSRR